MGSNDADEGSAACGEARAKWIAAAVRQLYSGSAPSGPAADALRATNRNNVVIRSDVYRRLRAWIVAHGLSDETIAGIRIFHTVIFTQLMGLVVLVTWSGLRNRFTRREGLALLGVAGEAGVVLLNQRRCPLTVVVEDLGAEHGSVSDILLPDWAARHIPHVSSGLLALGMVTLGIRRAARSRRGSTSQR